MPRKKRIVREAVRPSNTDAVAQALVSVLGSDAVHKASDSDVGEPKVFIPSGVPDLDKLLDRKGRGWPTGRIVEIYGASACIPANTLITVPDGILTLAELFEKAGYKATCTSRQVEAKLSLVNRYGEEEITSDIFWNNLRPVYKVTTSNGSFVESTANHPHLVLDDTGFFSWCNTSDLKTGDWLVRLSSNLAESEEFVLDKKAYTRGIVSGATKDKAVPLWARSSGPIVLRSFLRGYMDCVARFDGAGFSVFSPSMLLIQQIQQILQFFGVNSHIVDKVVEGITYWKIHITGGNAVRYLANVGTSSRDWVRTLKSSNRDVNNFPPAITKLVDSLYKASETTREHKLLEPLSNGKSTSCETLAYLLNKFEPTFNTSPLFSHLTQVCKYDYVQVASIIKQEAVPTFDVVMPKTHSFIANGFITHNTAKTGIGYALIAEAQKLGGMGIIYPSEGNWDEWLAQQYGIDFDRLVIGDNETVEGVFSSLQAAIPKVGKDGLLVAMIDSVAGLSTQDELEGEELRRDRAAQIRAMLMSKALRKLGGKIPRTNTLLFCVNQTRDAVDVQYGEKSKPPGGKALAFYSSVRLKLENIGKVTRQKAGKKHVAGFKIRITSVKNRLAMPHQQTELFLDFTNGLQPLKKK